MATHIFSLGCLILVALTMVYSHPREIIVEDDTPAVKSIAMENFDEENKEDMPCHVEYQVMKKTVGHCIKLGRSTRACVAGNYLHPFHPECM